MGEPAPRRRLDNGAFEDDYQNDYHYVYAAEDWEPVAKIPRSRDVHVDRALTDLSSAYIPFEITRPIAGMPTVKVSRAPTAYPFPVVKIPPEMFTKPKKRRRFRRRPRTVNEQMAAEL